MQGEQSLDRSTGGLGLGLSLVKRLVELHGGSVSARSAGPDQGSEFVVRLPLLLAAPPSPEPAETPRRQGSARRILLIEDDFDSRVALRMLLESWGYRGDEAEDGESGVEIAVVSLPDIALVDIGLPGLDGYAVAKTIRAAANGKGVHLVALTGYGRPEDYRRALEAGFDAYLVKPVDPNELVKVVTPEGA